MLPILMICLVKIFSIMPGVRDSEPHVSKTWMGNNIGLLINIAPLKLIKQVQSGDLGGNDFFDQNCQVLKVPLLT